MVTVLDTKTVTARKAHFCMTCTGLAIQPGETYVRQANLHDGRVYNWVTCRECDALTGEVWDWAGHPWDEGIGPDSYEEWANDARDDPEHGEAARAYLARRRRHSGT